jgi:hypothetical protein
MPGKNHRRLGLAYFAGTKTADEECFLTSTSARLHQLRRGLQGLAAQGAHPRRGGAHRESQVRHLERLPRAGDLLKVFAC